MNCCYEHVRPVRPHEWISIDEFNFNFVSCLLLLGTSHSVQSVKRFSLKRSPLGVWIQVSFFDRNWPDSVVPVLCTIKNTVFKVCKLICLVEPAEDVLPPGTFPIQRWSASYAKRGTIIRTRVSGIKCFLFVFQFELTFFFQTVQFHLKLPLLHFMFKIYTAHLGFKPLV